MPRSAATLDWIDRFPGLAQLEAPIKARLMREARIVRFEAGSVLFGPAKAPEHLLMLLSGTVRVQQQSETGREVVLYRVRGGESCVMTTACLLAYEDLAAEGIAETDVEAAAIPRKVFDDLISVAPEFRRFVFSAYARRISDLLQVIDHVAFRRMDIRLAENILARAQNGHLRSTHAQLAVELGTAREVISRQLAEFQRRGWIVTTRGEIEITDEAALRAFAAG